MNKRHTRVAASRPLLTVLLGCILMNHRAHAESHTESGRLSLCPSADRTPVTSEKELRQEILRRDVGARTIVLNMTELRLENTLSIESTGICLEGTRGWTVVHCPPDASAVVVKYAHVLSLSSETNDGKCSTQTATLALLNFTGCQGNPAVVVNKRGENKSDHHLCESSGNVGCANNSDENAADDGVVTKSGFHEVASDMKNGVRFIECRFHGNHAKFGGALHSRDTDVHLKKCVFKDNTAEVSGGAVHFESTNGNMLSTKQSKFRRNVAGSENLTDDASGKDKFRGVADEKMKQSGMGGAIFARNHVRMQFSASHFDRNKGCRGGGAIAVFHGATEQQDAKDAAVVSIKSSSFRKNQGFCGKQPGAFTSQEDSLGGALRVESSKDASSVTWRIRKASFVDNYARCGGAISFQSRIPSATVHQITSSIFNGNIALMNGGAITAAGIQLTVKRSQLKNGRALAGSGIHVSQGSVLKFVGQPATPSVIEENEAGMGGGIHARDSALDLAALTLKNNVAHFTGGGLRSEDTAADVILRGVTIIGNRSPIGGGAAFVAVSNVTVTSNKGIKTVVENNTASVGGGIHYDCSEASYFVLTMEDARFAANRALPLSNPKIAKLLTACHDFNPLPGSSFRSNHDLEPFDNSTDFIQLYSHSSEGHGGGISLTFVSLMPYAIAEVILQNLTVERNEAIVGGGISAEMQRHYWNKKGDLKSCLSAIPGYDACQKFEVHSIDVTHNRAQFAGGIFISHPNGVAFACGHNFSEMCLAGSLTHLVDGSEPKSPISSRIEENKLLDAKTESSQIGTRTVTLVVEGGKKHLRRVASGENVDLPCNPARENNCNCDDGTEKNCWLPLRFIVKDAFNQTIDGGIDDANLTISIFSKLIVGDHRYTAVNGTVTINSTRTWGINQTCTFTISSERDHRINAKIELHTRECYPGEQVNGEVCDRCLVEQYGFNQSLDKCRPCEANAVCSGGAVLVPREGYWHSTPFSPVFHRCMSLAACRYEGRHEHLEQFYAEPEKLPEYLKALEEDSGRRDEGNTSEEYKQCADGYRGPLCGSCEDGYGHSYTGECEACLESSAASQIRFFAAVLWLFLLIGANCAITLVSTDARVALAKYELRTRARSQVGMLPAPTPTPVCGFAVQSSRVINRQQSGNASDIFAAQNAAGPGIVGNGRQVAASIQPLLAKQLVATVLLTETLKVLLSQPTLGRRRLSAFQILINYLQVTGTALRLQTDWSGPLQTLLHIQASLVGSLTATVSTSYECGFQNHSTRASVVALWMKLTTPFIVVLVLLVLFVFVWSFTKIRDVFRQTSDAGKQSYGESLLTYTIVIFVVSLHLIYIDVVRELLRTVNCVDMSKVFEDIDPDHPYIEYATEDVKDYVWGEDTQLTCFHDSHLPLGITGIAGLIMAFLVVIAIVLWLPLNKKHKRKTKFISRYWFLFQGYRCQWYTVAWESTVLVRKSAIAAVVVFSVHMTPSLQASVCAGVLTISLALQAFFVPFKIPENHHNVPDYASDLFTRLGMGRLGAGWLRFNNAVHLNVLETASLSASASVFYTAIVLNDTTSSSLGRWLITVFSFAFNVVFLAYLMYRLYCGVHVVLDFKLQLADPDFLDTLQNSLSIRSIFVKARALYKTLKNAKSPEDFEDDVECQMTLEEHLSTSFVFENGDSVKTKEEDIHLIRSISI